ncbi:unnamed protein product [Pylaiella littoralis]
MAGEILHEVTAGLAAEQTGSVGGGGGGGYLFARAEESERIDEAVVDMLFDIDPRDPVVIAILVAVACVVVAVVWFGVNARGKRRVRWAPDPAGGDGSGDSGSDDGGGKGNSTPSPSPVVQRRYNTRGHRITTPGSSGGSSSSRASSPTSRQFRAEATKTVGLTLKQLQLCEVLYDLHAGVVPLRGIKSRAVRDCELSTAKIVRQFKKIKQARQATNGGKVSPSSGSAGTLFRSPGTSSVSPSPASQPSSCRATATIKKSPEPGKTVSPAALTSGTPLLNRASAAVAAASPKKPPASPRKSPVKRSAAARSTPSSPTSGGRGGMPAAKKRLLLASALPVSSPESPVMTRRKKRTPSVRIGSPKSAPIKRTAATAVAASSSSSGGEGDTPSKTPSKRGKPSVLEIARREAQQQVADVASNRAKNLRVGGGSSSSSSRGTKS